MYILNWLSVNLLLLITIIKPCFDWHMPLGSEPYCFASLSWVKRHVCYVSTMVVCVETSLFQIIILSHCPLTAPPSECNTVAGNSANECVPWMTYLPSTPSALELSQTPPPHSTVFRLLSLCAVCAPFLSPFWFLRWQFLIRRKIVMNWHLFCL